MKMSDERRSNLKPSQFSLNNPVVPAGCLKVAIVTAVIVVAVVSRRPDALINAQFWAEDGAVWYSDAYNLGVLHSLQLTTAGDYQIFPRLVAGLGLLLPLAYVPLMTNAIAIVIQSLPGVFLVTERFAYLASFGTRLVMAFLLVAVPTSFEVHANISNSMTFLALLAFLVFIAEPPYNAAWRTFDIAVVCISASTGPFCVFLLPVGIVYYFLRHKKWTCVLLAFTGSIAIVQGLTLALVMTSGRSHQPLGATLPLFIRIVGGQILVGPLLGMQFLGSHSAAANLLCVSAVIGAVVLTIYVFRSGPIELILCAAFGGLLLAAALRTPMVSLTQPQWPLMTIPGVGGRYWLIPVVSILWMYASLADNDRPKGIRVLGIALVCAALLTGVSNWRYEPFTDLHFPAYAQTFSALPPGQSLTIPINPGGWTMTLHKH